MSWVARAPGKLFLLGEYAVLDGAPAIVAAVDRFAEVRVEPAVPAGRVNVVAHDLGVSGSFDAASATFVDGPLRFVLAAYRAACERAPHLRSVGLTIRTADELRGSGGAKIGLGGSAAVTVATVAALLSAAEIGWEGVGARHELLALALAAHDAAQKTRGSGADVAASVFGGVLRFERPPGTTPAVRRLTLPAGGRLLVGWTGEAASTASLVEGYLTATNGRLESRRRFRDASARCVEEFERALERGELSAAAIEGGEAALRELEREAGLPLHTPRLDALIEAARTAGVPAKLSGAGGGDCGVALTCDATRGDRVLEAWRAAGITPVDLRVAAQGVTVTHG